MINKSIIIYVFIDELCKALGHQEDTRRKISDVQALIAALPLSTAIGEREARNKRTAGEQGVVYPIYT